MSKAGLPMPEQLKLFIYSGQTNAPLSEFDASLAEGTSPPKRLTTKSEAAAFINGLASSWQARRRKVAIRTRHRAVDVVLSRLSNLLDLTEGHSTFTSQKRTNLTGKNGRVRPSVGVRPPDAEDCSAYTETTQIASPDPAELAELSVGSVLGVELRNNGQKVVATNGRREVGALLPLRVLQLIGCMKRGFTYTASVVRISGGFCEVYIRCVGKP